MKFVIFPLLGTDEAIEIQKERGYNVNIDDKTEPNGDRAISYGLLIEGIDVKTGRVLVEVDPRFFRPAEVDLLWGDSSKAEKELGWKRDVSFEGLVEMMVESDLKKVGVK